MMSNHARRRWKPDHPAYRLFELIVEIPYPDEGYDAQQIAEDARLPLSSVRGRLKTMTKHGMVFERKIGRRLTYWPPAEEVQ